MTHPNIVFTPRQRIDQGNIASFTGPIPTKYSKYFFDFFFLLLDASRPIYNASRSIITASRPYKDRQSKI